MSLAPLPPGARRPGSADRAVGKGEGRLRLRAGGTDERNGVRTSAMRRPRTSIFILHNDTRTTTSVRVSACPWAGQ